MRMCNLLIKNVRMRNALEPVPMWYECHEMSYGWYLCGVRRHKMLRVTSSAQTCPPKLNPKRTYGLNLGLAQELSSIA